MLPFHPTLQQLLSEQKSSPLHFAAIYDEITLKCAEISGFKAFAYQSFQHIMPQQATGGIGMVNHARMILNEMEKLCLQTNRPLLCLDDPGLQGYDLEIFISRMENIGVGGCTLFDQHPWPSHATNSHIFGEYELLDRVKRVLDKRQQSTLLVAGTHIGNQQTGSMEQKIERLQLLAETGVDMILVQSSQSVEELRLFASQIPLSCLVLMPSIPESFSYNFRILQQIGYAAVCCINTPFLRMVQILQETYETLYNHEIPLITGDAIDLSQDIVDSMTEAPGTQAPAHARQQWVENMLKKKL